MIHNSRSTYRDVRDKLRNVNRERVVLTSKNGEVFESNPMFYFKDDPVDGQKRNIKEVSANSVW